MKWESKIVQRVSSHYVGEDCAQIMFPYYNALTILGQDGLLFHNQLGSDLYVNKYLVDKRKIVFPYSNIPTHISRRMFKKVVYTNQLLDFDKPYVLIGDGHFYESYVVKDNSEALLISSVMQPNRCAMTMTYRELLKFVSSATSDEKVYYVYLSGKTVNDSENLFPTEEEIHASIKKAFLEKLSDFKELCENNFSYAGGFRKDNELFLDYVTEKIKDIDFSLIDFNVRINRPFLVVRINEGNITIQGVEAMFVRDDVYMVDIYDIPVTRYNLEQLKYLSNIIYIKEPRIPLGLNPAVTKQDIKAARQMIKAKNVT